MNTKFEPTELEKFQAKMLASKLKAALRTPKSKFFTTRTEGEIPDMLLVKHGMIRGHNYKVVPSVVMEAGKPQSRFIYISQPLAS